MKIVIKDSLNSAEVKTSECSSSHYYGVESTSRDKGFIQRREYKCGEYVVTSMNFLTDGNTYVSPRGELKGVIAQLLS